MSSSSGRTGKRGSNLAPGEQSTSHRVSFASGAAAVTAAVAVASPPILTVEVDEDGRIVPFATEPPTLEIFGPELTKDDFRGCHDRVSALAVDSLGKRLFAASWDETVVVWDMTKHTKIAVLPHSDWVNCLALVNPSSTTTSSSATIPASLVLAGQQQQQQQLPTMYALTGTEDGLLTLWNLDTYDVEYQLTPGFAALTNIAVHLDMGFVTSLQHVYVVSVWSRSILRKFVVSSDALCVAVQRDAQTIFVGQSNGKISCWDMSGAFLVRELCDVGALAGESAEPSSNSSAARASSKAALKMEMPVLQRSGSRVVITAPVEGIAVMASPTEPSVDWNRALPAIRALCIDPSHQSGSFLIAANDCGSVVVWSTSTGELVGAFRSHHSKPVLGLAVLTRRRKKRHGGGGSSGSPTSSSSPTNNKNGGTLFSTSKVTSPMFHDAMQTFLCSCALDGTVQYHDMESMQSFVAHGAYGVCMVSHQDPETFEWKVFVGESQGKVRQFASTVPLTVLDEISGR